MMSIRWAVAIALLVWEAEQDKQPRVIGPFEDMDKAIDFKEKNLGRCHRVEYASLANAEYADEYMWGNR